MQRKPLAEQQEFVCSIAHVVVEKCSIIGDFMVLEPVHDLPLWSTSTGICGCLARKRWRKDWTLFILKMAILGILGRLYDFSCDVPQQINGTVQLMLPGFLCGQHRHFLVDSHLRWTEHHKAKSC